MIFLRSLILLVTIGGILQAAATKNDAVLCSRISGDRRDYYLHKNTDALKEFNILINTGIKRKATESPLKYKSRSIYECCFCCDKLFRGENSEENFGGYCVVLDKPGFFQRVFGKKYKFVTDKKAPKGYVELKTTSQGVNCCKSPTSTYI